MTITIEATTTMPRFQKIALLAELYQSTHIDLTESIYALFTGFLTASQDGMNFDIELSCDQLLHFDAVKVVPSLAHGFRIIVDDDYLIQPEQLEAFKGWLFEDVSTPLAQ